MRRACYSFMQKKTCVVELTTQCVFSLRGAYVREFLLRKHIMQNVGKRKTE